MGRIVLHIGTHKTGTTSIQRFAARHRKALLEAGLYYPCYSEIGRPAHYAHLDVAKAIMGSPTRLGVDGLAEFATQVRAKSHNNAVTLISSEPFWRGLPAGSRPKSRDDYWEMRRAFIEAVARVFPPDETEILLVVRGQADFAESLFKEDVKVNRWCHGLRKFVRQRWPYFCYAEQADLWASVFPRVTALPFDDLSRDGNLVVAFLGHLGVDAPALPHAKRHNESIQPDFVTALRMMNRSDLPKRAIALTREKLIDLQAVDEVRQWPKRSLWPNADARLEFDAAYQEENDRLIDRYGPPTAQKIRSRHLPDGTKFGERMTEDAITYLLKSLVLAAPEFAASGPQNQPGSQPR
ncbi:MAG: hypothetical protein AAGE80_02405 [Pseudomonadota bacterium]